MTEIGEALRERRMALKIDVHEVEETTKIRAKYLRALENEEYNLLPGPAYAMSFLRTYADYLGLDSRDLIDVYKSRQDRGDEDNSPFAARIDRGVGARESMFKRPWVVIVIALAIVLVVLFVIGTIGGGGSGA
jgi:cytoskeleton protein RodZ